MAKNTRRKIRTQNQQTVIDSSLQNMLKGLKSEVVEQVTKKWAEDQKAFFEAVKKENIGKEPHEWGKDNCKHCYGRGYDGIQVATRQKITCRCATKNYQKWLQAFREEFNAARDESNGKSDEQAQAPTNRPEDTTQAVEAT